VPVTGVSAGTPAAGSAEGAVQGQVEVQDADPGRPDEPQVAAVRGLRDQRLDVGRGHPARGGHPVHLDGGVGR